MLRILWGNTMNMRSNGTLNDKLGGRGRSLVVCVLRTQETNLPLRSEIASYLQL
jgi:hypothetical protein